MLSLESDFLGLNLSSALSGCVTSGKSERIDLLAPLVLLLHPVSSLACRVLTGGVSWEGVLRAMQGPGLRPNLSPGTLNKWFF